MILFKLSRYKNFSWKLSAAWLSLNFEYLCMPEKQQFEGKVSFF
jgi:hypothetical protein